MGFTANIFRSCLFLCLVSSTAQIMNLTLDCTNSVILTSPGYPFYYPNFIRKEWYIQAPSRSRIIVIFNDFSLEDVADSLAISDKVNTDNKRRYTGENAQFPPFLAQGHGLDVEFTSSRQHRRRGFNISVSCYEPSSTISSRLVEGISPSEGYLELPSGSGEWERVCDVPLPDQVAEVICGELGYPGVKEISYENSTCTSDGLKENCTRAPICQENTYRLMDCELEQSPCSSNMVVKIKCHGPGYKGCYKDIQIQNGFTFKTTAGCMSSCKTDDIQAIAMMDYEECLCTTTAEANLFDATECDENTESLSKVFVYNASLGFCDELNEVEGGSWDSNITWFGSIVHLTCMDGYSLNGSGTLQCTDIPGSTPYYPVWNDSSPSCINASLGFCDELNEVEGGSWDSNITRFGSIIHLTCMDGYTLNGSGTLQCIPGSTPYYPVWNDSSPSCINEGTPGKNKNLVILGIVITFVNVCFITAVHLYRYMYMYNRSKLQRRKLSKLAKAFEFHRAAHRTCEATNAQSIMMTQVTDALAPFSQA